VSEEEAKMRASRSYSARLEQFARGGEGDRILGIAEHARVKPDASRKVGGIDAELPEEHRRLRERSDTLSSLRHVLPVSRRPYSARTGETARRH
jgi:hypothetical protein